MQKTISTATVKRAALSTLAMRAFIVKIALVAVMLIPRFAIAQVIIAPTPVPTQGPLIGGSLTVPYSSSNCSGVLLQATCVPFGVDMTGTNDSTTIMQSLIAYDCAFAHPVPITLGPGVLKTGPVTIPCAGIEIDGTGNGGHLFPIVGSGNATVPGTAWLWNSAVLGTTAPLVTIGTATQTQAPYADKLKNISFQSASGVGAQAIRLYGAQLGDYEDLSFDQWSQTAVDFQPVAGATLEGDVYGNYFARISWYNMSNSGGLFFLDRVTSPVIHNADFNEFHDVIANTSSSGGLTVSCNFCDNNNFYNVHVVGNGATTNISLYNGAVSNNFYGYSCSGVVVDATSNFNTFNEDDSANGCAPPTFASGGVGNTAKVYGTTYGMRVADTLYADLGNTGAAPVAGTVGAFVGGNLSGSSAPQPSGNLGTNANATPITAIASNRTGTAGESDFINLFSTTQSGDAFHFIYEKSTGVDYDVANITRLGGVCAGNGTTGYVSSGPCLFGGNGVPTFSAPNGSLYLNVGGGTGAREYVNTSGATITGTTWTAVSGI